MKCPKCGFVSFNYLDNCKRCGMDLADYKKRSGITAEPAITVRSKAPLKKKIEQKPEEPKKLHDSVIDSHEKAPKAPASPAIAESDHSRVSLDERAQQLKKEADARRMGVQQAELFRDKAEKEVRGEARRIRERIEREARERAEKIQRKIEEEAHAEALKIRMQREREAKEQAEKMRQRIEAEALERAEKMREEIERDARERAERIRRETERVAKEEAAKIRNESEREALAIAEDIRRRTEAEARQQAEEIRRQYEQEVLTRSTTLNEETKSEARKLAENIFGESEREAKSEIEAMRMTALEEAEKLKQKALAEAVELKQEAEKIARETIEKAFAEARERGESWFDGRVTQEERNGWKAPVPAREEIGEREIYQDDTQTVSEEILEEGQQEEEKADPEDQPEWAKTRESATQEKSKMKNIPTAGDYLELLAQKGEKSPEAAEGDGKSISAMIAQQQVQTGDAPIEEKADAGISLAENEPVQKSDTGSDEEFIEEEVIEIEDESGRGKYEKSRSVGMSGLMMRCLGGIVDTGILVFILALFIFIGKAAFSVAGQSAGWAPFLRLSGPIYVLFFMIATGYFTVFIGGTGQTPAMMFFGLKVVDKHGELIGYNLAFLRHSFCLLSFLFLGLGFLGIPMDRNKQGWHDKLTRSVVIRV